jgi:hypothetical protein
MIVLAITFAATAFKRAQTFLLPRNGMATAGLVLGIIGAVLYAIAGVLSFGLLFIV